MKPARFLTQAAIIITVASLLVSYLSNNGFSAEPKNPELKTVRLVIDYNDGVEKHFTKIPWKSDMTVLDAMRLAMKYSRGIKFKYKGSGASTFLTQIDDLKNEGGGTDKRNWLFWVNTKRADKSFGVYKLKATDVVLWKFARYKP